MRPVPIPDDLLNQAGPGFRRIVVAGPSGDLLADGSTPDQAERIEALHGAVGAWPCWIERWVPERDEFETWSAAGWGRWQVELRLYVPQLVVHSLRLVAS